jgi:hypothetical protein
MMKPSERFMDKLFPVMFIILAVCVSISIWRLPYLENTGHIGPKMYPWLLSALLLLLSGLLLTGRVSSASEHPKITPRNMLRRFLPFLVICSLYSVSLQSLGFLLPTTAFLVASFYFLGERNHWKNILIAVCCTGATYLLFVTALGVQVAAFPGQY